MLSLGYQNNKIARIPHVPKLEESNIRQGFFEHHEYLALLKALPPGTARRRHLYLSYRVAEIGDLGLTWDQVDLQKGTVHLEPGQTKNKAGRLIYLDDELLKLLSPVSPPGQGLPFRLSPGGQADQGPARGLEEGLSSGRA